MPLPCKIKYLSYVIFKFILLFIEYIGSYQVKNGLDLSLNLSDNFEELVCAAVLKIIIHCIQIDRYSGWK